MTTYLSNAISYNSSRETKIAEKTDTQKYKIDGQEAAAFSYFLKPQGQVELFVENIYTVHNGKEYELHLEIGVNDTNYSTIADIEHHIINSTKWLN